MITPLLSVVAMRKWLLPTLIIYPLRASADLDQQPLASSQLSESQTCPQPHISCPSSTPSDVDTCCLNHPSGHFLMTQFWDASPSLGPADSWTIHGLWPDRCHGGFDQFCDSSRSHSDIHSILSSSSTPDLTDYMSKYWLALNSNDNHLWSHEWNKHGTCISTLEPSCYPSPSDDDEDLHKDVLDYFTHATTLFSTLNTYDALAASNIIPTHRRAYDLADLQSAISTLQGAEVTFRCHGHELQEIWYHFTVHGPLRDAPTFSNTSVDIAAIKHKFRAAEPDGSKTNCPATGIRYLPKQPHQPLPTHSSSTTTSTSTPTATAAPFSGKGHLLVRPINSTSSNSTTQGCLIRSGKWYLTSGSSCANYIARTDPKHLSPTSWPWPPSPEDPDAGDVDEEPIDEVYAHPVDADKDNDEGHLFTLSSLYAPCAIIPSAFPSGGGLFLCEKNLGIQSIFESVCDSDDDENGSSKKCKGGKFKLAHMSKSTFYADSVPGKFEKELESTRMIKMGRGKWRSRLYGRRFDQTFSRRNLGLPTEMALAKLHYFNTHWQYFTGVLLTLMMHVLSFLDRSCLP